jgi:hydrogenase 3 maturation protease
MKAERMLLGVGNTLKGDDGVGPYIANNFVCSDWHVIDCGTAPENFTGVVKHHFPSLVMIVDAAMMGKKPGDISLISHDRISEIGFSTHSLSLALMTEYLLQHKIDVIIIGIEPLSMELGDEISEVVMSAAEELIKLICNEKWDTLPSIL